MPASLSATSKARQIFFFLCLRPSVLFCRNSSRPRLPFLPSSSAVMLQQRRRIGAVAAAANEWNEKREEKIEKSVSSSWFTSQSQSQRAQSVSGQLARGGNGGRLCNPDVQQTCTFRCFPAYLWACELSAFIASSLDWPASALDPLSSFSSYELLFSTQLSSSFIYLSTLANFRQKQTTDVQSSFA